MKLFREDGEKAYNLIKEAKQGKLISDDYNTSNSSYVTTVYETNTAKYKIVDNIDLGVLYSVEKIEK